jgi:hypothetical protein
MPIHFEWAVCLSRFRLNGPSGSISLNLLKNFDRKPRVLWLRHQEKHVEA